jgi:hypothetical protein
MAFKRSRSLRSSAMSLLLTLSRSEDRGSSPVCGLDVSGGASF